MDIDTHRTTYSNEDRVVAVQPPVGAGTPATAVPFTTVPATEVHTVRTAGSVMPAAVVAGLVSIFTLILGGITVARAGIDTPYDQHVVNVAGFTATALLGYIELGFGVLLLIAALSRARQAILFFGIVGFIAAVVGIFQPTVGNGSLAMERGFAVLMAVLTGVVTLAAFLPTMRHSTDRIERI